MDKDRVVEGFGKTPEERAVSMLDQLTKLIYGSDTNYPAGNTLKRLDGDGVYFSITRFNYYLNQITDLTTKTIFRKHISSMIALGQKNGRTIHVN